MKYPLISVIVPIYNAEKYLARCIESVLKQTYPNLEILLINDGSTDDSKEICKRYASEYPLIKYIEKNNGGQSSARNLGLEICKGEYIGFVDSDDWISCDMYKYLYELIQRTNADVAQIGLLMVAGPEDIYVDNSEKVKIISARGNILKYYLEVATKRSGEYSICRCLIRSDIAKSNRFREGKINEDIDYKYRVLSKSSIFVVSNKICYYYFQSGNSTSTGKLKKKDFQLYEASKELLSLTEKEEDKYIRFLGQVKYARTPFSLLSRIAYYGIEPSCGDRKIIIKQLSLEHRNNLWKLLKAPLPLSRKVLAIAFAINFKLVNIPLSFIRK